MSIVDRSSRWRLRALAIALALGACVRVSPGGDGGLGQFNAQGDVGTVAPPGTATFDAGGGTYKVTSSGANVWNKHDDFHFVYRKASGDVSLTADVAFVGEGKNAHRKGGLMIRQDLDADAAYVDVMVHGDGLIGLQYRTAKGEVTSDVKAKVKAPAVVRVERHGDAFTAYAAARGEGGKPGEFESIGSIKVALKDPVYVGLAVSSHDPSVTETVTFGNVEVKAEGEPKK